MQMSRQHLCRVFDTFVDRAIQLNLQVDTEWLSDGRDKLRDTTVEEFLSDQPNGTVREFLDWFWLDRLREYSEEWCEETRGEYDAIVEKLIVGLC